MSVAEAAWLLGGGIVVGVFGGLLGIGGGVFLVPLLVLALHVPIHEAIGTSLVCIIATSSIVAAINLERGLVNIGLGTTLELATTLGAVAGGIAAGWLSERQLTLAFGVTLLIVTGLMLVKQRMAATTRRSFEAERGLLGGYYVDPASGTKVGYRVRRLPLAMATGGVAGTISGMLGIGGAVLTVPALNLFNGVPMKAAIATSNSMIGVTAVAGAIVYYLRGEINPGLTVLVVLGVLAGSLAGAKLTEVLRANIVRIIFIVVILAIAGRMLAKATR